MKNQVIKVLNKEHGAKVIEYWKSKGVDTYPCTGRALGKYYGVIDNYFSYWDKIPNNTEEIFILPKRVDKILVWDEEDKKTKKRIFLTYIEGATNPVVCVDSEDEYNFLNGKAFVTIPWKYWSFIEEDTIVELTMEDISNGKGVGIKPELIRIKK